MLLVLLSVESCLERLQAYVFGESGPLHPILECEQGSRTSGGGGGASCEGGGAVCVGQQVLDIELWLAEVLRGPLSRQQLQQYFLSDYAVHVSSVSGRHHNPTHNPTLTPTPSPPLPHHRPSLSIGLPPHRDG